MKRSLPPALPPLILLILLLSVTLCRRDEETATAPAYRSWEEITAGDTLRIGTMTSPTDFYIYRGEPFGWEYRKARAFADANDLKLGIEITGSRDSLEVWLEEGRIDLSITPFAMTADNKAAYGFAGPVDTIDLVLVQNMLRNDTPPLRRVGDLEGKTIRVPSGSPAELRLRQIAQEVALDSLTILPTDTLGDLDLIRLVAEQDIYAYTVVDSRLAKLFAAHYPGLDTDMQLSVPLRYGWMIHRDNLSLGEAIDHYFAGEGRQLAEQPDLVGSSYYFRAITRQETPLKLPPGAISPFDDLFRREAERLGWHWSYLAAIAYTESRFIPDVVARSGARGLMGIMPGTGRAYGATREQLLEPATAVRVSVDCLRANEATFDFITEEHERKCFTLAAYNSGAGHVLDAIRLAKKYNAPDSIWEGGVRDYLLLKSSPKYFNDPVVRYGYVRGSETVKYVDNIMSRAALYQAHDETKP